MRAVMGLLSQELFGDILALPDFSERTSVGSASVTAINTPSVSPYAWTTRTPTTTGSPGSASRRWPTLSRQVATSSSPVILLPGERIITDSFRVDPAHRVRLEAMRMIEHVSGDGLDLVVELEIDAHVFTVTQVHLGNE